MVTNSMPAMKKKLFPLSMPYAVAATPVIKRKTILFFTGKAPAPYGLTVLRHVKTENLPLFR